MTKSVVFCPSKKEQNLANQNDQKIPLDQTCMSKVAYNFITILLKFILMLKYSKNPRIRTYVFFKVAPIVVFTL